MFGRWGGMVIGYWLMVIGEEQLLVNGYQLLGKGEISS